MVFLGKFFVFYYSGKFFIIFVYCFAFCFSVVFIIVEIIYFCDYFINMVFFREVDGKFFEGRNKVYFCFYFMLSV